MSKAGKIRTGDGGLLKVKQFYIDGKRLTDGTAWFKTPRFWVTNGPWAGLREKVDGVRGWRTDQFLEKRE